MRGAYNSSIKKTSVRRGSGLSCREAFSLVEVTLALGVISFAMIAMVGLIPLGLTTLRQAIDSTTQSEIVQQFSAQTRLTKYTMLGSQYAGVTFYYDSEGTFLTNSSTASPASAPSNTRYWVTANSVSPAYPGSTNAPAASPMANNLAAMSLQIVSAPSAGALVKSTNDYVIMVPNSGS